MSRDAIAARNRANAGHSTGPRTARGKAVVAQNARRHGMTGRLDVEAVATRLRIILDSPGLEACDLPQETVLGQAALKLAEADVREHAAQRALNNTVHERQREVVAFAPLKAALAEAIMGPDMSAEARRALRGFTMEVFKARLAELRALKEQERLLLRYLREARAERRRAFAAWIAVLGENRGDEGRGLSQRWPEAKIPKQTQITTIGRNLRSS